MRDDARRLLQERSASRILDADLTRWANEGESIVAAATRCLRSTEDTAAVSGTDTYSVAVSALASWGVTRVDFNGVELDEVPWDRRRAQLDAAVPVTANATPQMWSPYGQSIVLTPPPDTTDTIKQYFAHLPDAMSLDADTLTVPGTYGPLVVHWMVYKGLWILGKPEEAIAMLDRFFQLFQLLTNKQMADRAKEAANSA
jgi:hypothetical protein